MKKRTDKFEKKEKFLLSVVGTRTKWLRSKFFRNKYLKSRFTVYTYAP